MYSRATILQDVNIRKKLGSQIPNGYAFLKLTISSLSLNFVAGNYLRQKPIRVRIFNAPIQYAKQNALVHAVKKLLNITFEREAGPSAVLTHLPDNRAQPRYAFVGALSHPTRE